MTEDPIQHVDAEPVTTTALESIERASIDMQISTAKKYPMHSPKILSQVKDNMLTLATMDEETASACFYTLPRGNKTIQGPSVRLAEIALNCYGNIRVGTRILDVVSSGPEPHVVIQSVCHDLENNALITIEKRRRITKKKSRSAIDEDDIQLAVNACTSIAYRDAAFKLIPMALIKPVWQAAKQLAIGDVKSLTEKRGVVIDRLQKMGATVDRILAVVDCRSVDDIGTEELGQLIGLGTALKEGDTTLEAAFPVIQEPVDQGTGALADRLQGKENESEPKQNEEPEKKRGRKNKTQKTAPKEEPNETETAEPTEPTESNKVPEAERFYCNDCGEVFASPAGSEKPLCRKCLSDNIVDRWK